MKGSTSRQDWRGGVWFFVHTLDDRGVARVVKAITAELARQGVPVAVVCAVRDTADRSGLTPEVPVLDLGIASRGTIFAIPRLARALRRHRPSVLFAHGPGPNRASVLAKALAGTRTALVLVEHVDTSGGLSEPSRSRLGRTTRNTLEAVLYPRADRIAGVSPGVVDDLARRHPSMISRLRLLPNPAPAIGNDAAEPRVPIGAPCAEMFGEGATIVCVANLIPRKGQLVLIEALGLLRRTVPSARLVLVGRPDDPEYVDGLLRTIARLDLQNSVCLAGYQVDVMPFIAASDVLALSSYREGYGLVLVEAMACGTPVVATDCPSGPAYVLEGGRSGLLTPVGDPAALADALARVLTDAHLAARLTENGRERARAFHPSRVAELYRRVASELIDQRTSASS